MNLKETLANSTEKEILAKLDIDEHYYGEYGMQFLSNSDIYKLINNPKMFHTPTEPHINLLYGGAFHTMVLEPEKMDQYKVIDASTRYTKKYKEESQGELTLLKTDIESLTKMKEVLDGNEIIKDILRGDGVEYEVPAYQEIGGEFWKGKADAVNHNDKLIIDVKTTGDISKFHLSAKRYNYDSQAYIYKMLFGYDMVFVVIDKKTHQLGFFDCSQNFYKTGKNKVTEAIFTYRMYFKDKPEGDFDWNQYLINETL